MAKGKNVNPADAYRKAQRKKELKKNKAERAQARDFALVKKDTSELDDEIAKLESQPSRSPAEQTRLDDVKAELAKVMKKKEDWVEEHPEHRKLVFRARRRNKEDEVKLPTGEQKRNLFDKHGLPRHPERSIYYDPVMNPYGVAPPGMPYIERPLRPDEIDSDEDKAQGSDDIVMPVGRPPIAEDAQSDSDDDIALPEGPPPPKDAYDPIPSPSQSSSGPPLPPLPPSLPPHPHQLPVGAIPFPYPLPMGYMVPPPPPLQPGFAPSLPAPFPPTSLAPMPPGFFPRRVQSTPVIEEHWSSLPPQPRQPNLPSNRTSGFPAPSSRPIAATAIVSAAPQLRDLKKEATAFVPTSLKRKKPATVSGSGLKVNAAPSVGSGSGDVDSEPSIPTSRPDLLSTLKDQFGPPPQQSTSSTNASKRHKWMSGSKEASDYDKFLEDMGDILAP